MEPIDPAFCRHQHEVISDDRDHYPSDTVTLEFLCLDCGRYRTQEYTPAEMRADEAVEREMERRSDVVEGHLWAQHDGTFAGND